MKRSTKKFTAAVAGVAVAGLAIGLALSLWTRPSVVVNHSAADTSSNTVIPMNTEQKTYDENNIGELYCKAVDEEHIGSSEAVQFMDDELLVVAQDGVAKTYIEELAEKYGAEIVGEIEQTGDYQWQLSDVKTLDELKQLAEQVKKEEAIVSADVNYVSNIGSESVDYDINVGKEWSDDFLKGYDPLKNKVKLSADDKMWNMKAINAPMAWKSMELKKDNIEPVKVGLIDTGFDTKHEDLGFAENGVFYLNGANSNEDRDIDTNVKTEDIPSHGTHVAGIMAASGDNDDGICGIYPYANGRLYGVSSAGMQLYKENFIYRNSIMTQKIAYSELILRNVKVINQSQGFNWQSGWEDYWKEQLNTDESWEQHYSKIPDEIGTFFDEADLLGDFLNRLLEKDYDFVITASAGNYSSAQTGTLESRWNSWNTMIDKDKYPNVYNRIIVVGAVNAKNNITSFSCGGERVDIFAPGDNIYSTMPNNKYDRLKGTSMAAPHVAGVCADVWSIDNTLTGEKVKEIVCGSVTDASKKDYPVVDCFKAVEWAFKEKKENGGPVAEPLYGEVMGWVTDSSNKKLKGAVVTAVNKADKSDKTTVKTDSYGHFELLLTAGDYKISVTKSGYQKAGTEVSVSGGEVNYLSDYIKLKKNLTKAEKYAKAVMDNEDMWLSSFNKLKALGYGNYCWFEDLDFDGEKEFVIGGSTWEDEGFWIPSTKRYFAYKITSDGKLKRIDGYHDTDNIQFISFFANCNYVDFKGNQGFNDIGMEVIKHTDTGKYERVYLGAATGGDYYSFCTVNFTSEKKVEKILTGFDNTSDMITENQYWDVIIDPVANYMENTLHCDNAVITIPCTSLSKKITANGYGCYDYLSKEDKMSALVNSFNGNKLTVTDKESNVVSNYMAKARTLTRDGKYVSSNSDPDGDTVYQMPEKY